ncbi:hypothetical protein TRAPUB_10008 [Trametes pubescens]|uniref:Uncharacterized protein n=1 Tax=Trametes pubescens TaxID=154538 RepID=A0A1M2W0P9_TRAPU|nr:hypothetical protein TRAPUB_10008 [Trametes pubescens]
MTRPTSGVGGTARTGLCVTRDVHGFKFARASFEDGRPCWRREGALAAKVARILRHSEGGIRLV